jgi:hypothetical protein
MMSICHQKINCRNIIFMTTIFEGLNVLSPLKPLYNNIVIICQYSYMVSCIMQL